MHHNGKWFPLTLAAVAAAGIVLTGGCATWCHEHDDDCIPICVFDKEAIHTCTLPGERLKKPTPYNPVGDPEIDQWGVGVETLANRVYNEFVIDYFEGVVDSESCYVFFAEVEQCSKQNKISAALARQLIWAEWVKEDLQRPSEERRCQDLCDGFNALKSKEPEKRIAGLLALEQEIQKLLQGSHTRAIKRIQAENKENPGKGIPKVFAVVNNSMRATNLLRDTDYMLKLYRTVADAGKDFERFEEAYKNSGNKDQRPQQ